ncbi:MAG: hypothetical protein C3F06_06050 [Candidatus Methanoperedenaceae archaeon]|nr:MAG: hypothetical protein C3F06_06050 [Candidatus Methanoperedenaceae archaeon]
MQSAALGGLDHMEMRPDRKLLLFSAVLLIAGTAEYWVAQWYHEECGVTPNEVFTDSFRPRSATERFPSLIDWTGRC